MILGRLLRSSYGLSEDVLRELFEFGLVAKTVLYFVFSWFIFWNSIIVELFPSRVRDLNPSLSFTLPPSPVKPSQTKLL
jgi:hypothetical protein